MKVFLLILTALIAYPLGNFNGAIIASRYVFHEDVRAKGSGNPGLNNYFRNFGAQGILIVLAIDILKTVVAVVLGGLLLGTQGYPGIGKLFAGFCAMLGHAYPVLYRFKGGKSVLCGVTMAFLLDWRVGVCCLTVFLVTVLFTRYVSLGSMLGAVACPLMMLAFGYDGLHCLLALLCLLLIVFRHGENIVRLIGGTERKLSAGGSRPRRRDDEEFR